jgi:hypothetical protein
VHHSDRGLQYASPEYAAALEKYGMRNLGLLDFHCTSSKILNSNCLRAPTALPGYLHGIWSASGCVSRTDVNIRMR